MEPAFEGFLNALLLEVEEHDSGEPVMGVEQTLRVEVTHIPTNTSKMYGYEPASGIPGLYLVDLIPTAPGAYRFRLFGKIGMTDVNETFQSAGAGGKFDDIEVVPDIQFPQPIGSLREIDGVARGAATSAQQARQSSADASSAATSARAMAMVGIVLGAIGAATGGVALLRGRAGH